MPDSNHVAIGARHHGGNGNGSGQIRVFNWNGTSWNQKGIDIYGQQAGDQSGFTLNMPDSNTICVSTPYNDDTGSDAGQCRVFEFMPCTLSATITSSIGLSCNGTNDGSIIVTQSGGAGIFTYNWSNHTDTIVSLASTDTLINLQAGTYTVTVTDTNGCVDSATTTLSKPMPIINFLSDTVACDSFFWAQTSTTYYSSGIYDDSLLTATSCDSIVRLNVSIFTPTFSVDSVVACGNYTWSENNSFYQTTNENFIKVDSVIKSSASACDSTIYLYLQILEFDTSITVRRDTLIANEVGNNLNYQWMNCHDSSIIAGADSQVFVPQQNGNYAVIFTKDAAINASSCTDTSACINLQLVNLNKNELSKEIHLYPNPTSGTITLSTTDQSLKNELIEIFDLQGRIVFVKEASMGKEQQSIQLEQLNKGIYFLKFQKQFAKFIIK